MPVDDFLSKKVHSWTEFFQASRNVDSCLVVSLDESNWTERAEQMVLDTRRTTFLVDEPAHEYENITKQSTKRSI